jgi:hypothetical protein
MKTQLIAGSAAVVIAAAVSAAAGQQPPAARQGQPLAAPITVTVVGCVEFEQDYRKRMAAGRGGVLGSGVGASDEFVLTNVRPADAEVGTTGRAGRGSAAKPANPGSGGGVYSMTGPQEKNLKREVGRQIEVVGVVENAGKPSTGAELTDISDLPRIAIQTWHPVNDFCPAK